MSQVDDNLREDLKGVRAGRGRRQVLGFNDQMAAAIGTVTSRDDIIDPYALVNPANYRKTRAGQAQYNADLKQAQLYAERQEAAYQEWYNSPEQQAIRDRAAGLNPDLIGLSGSESSDTAQDPNSPTAGMATNGQMALDSINTVMSAVQTAASVATLAAGIPNIGKQGELIAAQTEAQQLANVSAFEQTAHNAIASKFATFHAAQTALGNAVDVAAYFADDNNFSDILPSYAPSDNPMYKHALDRVRKGSESVLAKAYSTNQEAQLGQQSFARLLANPYSNPNTVLMASFLEPMMQAVFDMDRALAEFSSAEAKFKSDAMSSVDASQVGQVWLEGQEQSVTALKLQNIIDTARSVVFDNLRKTYLESSDPTASNSASLLLLGHYETTLEGLLVNWLKGRLTNRKSKSQPSPEVQAAVESASEYIERMQDDGFLLVD